MKICPSCGTENIDGALVCSKCSALLDNENQQFNNQNPQFNPGDVQQNQRPARTKKNKKIWGFSLAGILGVVVIVVVLNVMGIFMSPTEKIVAALRGNLSLNNINSTFKISLKGTPSDEFPAVLNNMSLNGYISKNGEKSYSQFSIVMDDNDVFNCVAAKEDKNLIFAIGEKALCIDVDEIMKSNLNAKSYSNLTKYISEINLNKIFSREYDKAIIEVIQGKTIKDNGKYIVTLDKNDMFNIVNKIMDIAAEDENLYNEIYNIMMNINENAKKDKVDLGFDLDYITKVPKETIITEMKGTLGILKLRIKNNKDETLSSLPDDFKCVLTADIGLTKKIKTFKIATGTNECEVLINFDNTKSIKKRTFDKKASVVINDIEKDEDKIINYFTEAILGVLSNEKLMGEMEKEGVLDEFKYFTGMDLENTIKFLSRSIFKELTEGF